MQGHCSSALFQSCLLRLRDHYLSVSTNTNVNTVIQQQFGKSVNEWPIYTQKATHLYPNQTNCRIKYHSLRESPHIIRHQPHRSLRPPSPSPHHKSPLHHSPSRRRHLLRPLL